MIGKEEQWYEECLNFCWSTKIHRVYTEWGYNKELHGSTPWPAPPANYAVSWHPVWATALFLAFLLADPLCWAFPALILDPGQCLCATCEVSWAWLTCKGWWLEKLTVPWLWAYRFLLILWEGHCSTESQWPLIEVLQKMTYWGIKGT